MDSNAFLSWKYRRSQLVELNEQTCVIQAQEEAMHAASHLPQTDNNAANTYASNQRSLYLIDQDDDCEQLGKRLDRSMAILWSIKKGVAETNIARLRASKELKSMTSSYFSDSSRDFISINCLESNREGTVELVRCKFDRQIYILKSTTKGAAKRGYKSNAPMNERRLLTLSQKEIRGRSNFMPSCIASFQSQASLHILMEYCPAGDLYHFLESAGQAPKDHEARNGTGGLLSLQYVRSYAIDIVAAVSWLHAQGFMHRDIKPGNWLIDRSGHLLMCDLASSAPFARFDEVPATANLPYASGGGGNGGLRQSKRNQRRVLYRHCCLIGTADYIAPEIFWSADLMSRRSQRQKLSSSGGPMDASITLPSSSTQSEEEGEDDDEPPPEGPGLYGPECDWWSVGILLYEMVYKQLPFFSEKIADTMEMIKNHKQFFHIDHRVTCSEELRDLITRLITDVDHRLGTDTSSDIQQHPFFVGVDWSRPWQNPAPFVPHLESIPDTTDGSSQPEPSILHSPRVGVESQSYDAGPMNWSKLWSNDENEFPVFPNSVEISRAELNKSSVDLIDNVRQGNDHSIGNLSGKLQRSQISYFDQSRSQQNHNTIAQWSGFDPTWIGFSYIPSKDAFNLCQPDVQGQVPSSSPPVEKIDSSDVSASNLSPEPSAPIESTPPRAKKVFDQRSIYKPRESLHRHAMQTATKMREASGSSSKYDGRFVTPVRQTSYSNLNGSAKAVQGESSTMAPIPASPYPFPVAQSARPKKTPYVRGTLKRNDLQRARSASAATGEGSESRCSGGSNAKREISEREAWHDLISAVGKSARKGRDYERELMAEVDLSKASIYHGAVQDSSESRIDESHVPRDTLPARKKSDETGGHKFVKAQRKPPDKRLATAGNGQPPLEPIVDTSPVHAFISPTSSASSASPAMSPEKEHMPNSIFSSLSLKTPKSHLIGKRKSTRQLLLKAQHRDTPTRIARTASPMLLEPPGNLTALLVKPDESGPTRMTGKLTRGNSDTAISLKQPINTTGQNDSVQPKMGQPIEQQGGIDHSNAHKPKAITQFKRRHSNMMLRRRDSHEIMSQYRKGVNPDADLEAENTSGHGRDTSNSTLTVPDPNNEGQRPAGLVLNTTSTARMIDRIGISLSSPGLPGFPDAFGGTSPTSENEIHHVPEYLRPVSAPAGQENFDLSQKQRPSSSLKECDTMRERGKGQQDAIVKPLAVRATNRMQRKDSNAQGTKEESKYEGGRIEVKDSGKKFLIDEDDRDTMSDTKVTHRNNLYEHLHESKAETQKMKSRLPRLRADSSVHISTQRQEVGEDDGYDQLRQRYHNLQDQISIADAQLAKIKARLRGDR